MFISIFILVLFQPPLWLKYLFSPCISVAIYLFHPFSPTKIFISKTLQAPQYPPHYSNSGLFVEGIYWGSRVLTIQTGE